LAPDTLGAGTRLDTRRVSEVGTIGGRARAGPPLCSMNGRGATRDRVVTSGTFEATARRPAVLGRAAVASAGLATFVAAPEGTDGTRPEMDGRGAGSRAVGARARDGPARGCTDGRDAVGGTAAV
jgi:hypothetical protein